MGAEGAIGAVTSPSARRLAQGNMFVTITNGDPLAKFTTWINSRIRPDTCCLVAYGLRGRVVRNGIAEHRAQLTRTSSLVVCKKRPKLLRPSDHDVVWSSTTAPALEFWNPLLVESSGTGNFAGLQLSL
jgi:hypothetical protein